MGLATREKIAHGRTHRIVHHRGQSEKLSLRETLPQVLTERERTHQGVVHLPGKAREKAKPNPRPKRKLRPERALDSSLLLEALHLQGTGTVELASCTERGCAPKEKTATNGIHLSALNLRTAPANMVRAAP